MMQEKQLYIYILFSFLIKHIYLLGKNAAKKILQIHLIFFAFIVLDLHYKYLSSYFRLFSFPF